MQHLTKLDHVELARQQIAALFETHFEWFQTINGGRSLALNRGDLEVNVSHGNLILSCWTDTGICSWRIGSWRWNGEKLILQASRRMGAENPVIELIPRAAATAVAATVRAARQARCHRLAELLTSQSVGVKAERATLSPGIKRGQPGRYARIILRLKHQRVAVTASVASHRISDADAYLGAALLWFSRASERLRPPYLEQLWLVVEGELIKAILPRIPLLKASLQQVIHVLAIDNDWTELQPMRIPERGEFWRKRLARFPPHLEQPRSRSAQAIVAERPDAIDVVQAKHGETLRYFGLPFARVRNLMGVERVWFGLDGTSRRLLDERSAHEWHALLTDLEDHRSATAEDHRHALYRNASEAWLESILRRDISKLDPGLIVAPLYAQFRMAIGGRLGVRPIDLLALRQDGRLVVIELKVAEDREHVLQGVGYWQRVEAHRRRGNITRARLFEDRDIRNEPPLVYLVAPTLRVHRAFNALARFITPDIEIYRFDINEDWRAGVRVMRRVRAN
jgi:hypothetical protein